MPPDTYTRQPKRVSNIQIAPVLNPGGNVTACTVTIYYSAKIKHDTDESKSIDRSEPPVIVPLFENPDQVISANGVDVTYVQLARLLVQLAEDVDNEVEE